MVGDLINDPFEPNKMTVRLSDPDGEFLDISEAQMLYAFKSLNLKANDSSMLDYIISPKNE